MVKVELVRVDEAARALAVHPATIRRLIAAGTLPAVRIGRCVRVSRAELARLTGTR